MKYNLFALSVKLLIVLSVLNLAISHKTHAQCIPLNDCSGNFSIQSFSTTGGVTNFTNTNTGCSTMGGYTFYSNMECSQYAGLGINFTFTNNNHYVYIKFWVDWNANNVFTDPGEEVYAPPSVILPTTTIMGPITVPVGTTPGIKRLRIRLKDFTAGSVNNLTPCNPSTTAQIGETEDYLINVLPSLCSGTPPTATTIAANTAPNCNATTLLSLQGNTTSVGLSYQWQYNVTGTWINFGTNAETQMSIPITQNTQFRCIVTCPNPLASSATSIPVWVNTNPPVLNIDHDTTICPGTIHTLIAGGPNNTYLWSTGATTPSIIVNAANIYTVKVTFPTGCMAFDTILITPGITPLNNLSDTVNLCAGSTTTLSAGNTGSSFLWIPGNQTTQTKTVSTEGYYSVVIKSSDGCVATNKTYVKARPLPIVHLGNDTTICQSQNIVLDAGNPGASYQWNTGDTTQTIFTIDSGTYKVLITSPYHCSINDEQHIAYAPMASSEGFNFIPQFFEHLGQVLFSPINPQYADHYDWDFGDGSPHSALMNPSHTFTSAGPFNVTLRVYNECSEMIKSQVINVDIATGIVTVNNDPVQVMVYPNPSADIIYIENKTPGVKMKHINIYNMLGALIYAADADSFKKHMVAIKAFASAVYSIQIQLDNGMLSKKVEIVH